MTGSATAGPRSSTSTWLAVTAGPRLRRSRRSPTCALHLTPISHTALGASDEHPHPHSTRQRTPVLPGPPGRLLALSTVAAVSDSQLTSRAWQRRLLPRPGGGGVRLPR